MTAEEPITSEVRAFVLENLHSYTRKRDVDKVLADFASNIFFIPIGETQGLRGLEELEPWLRHEFAQHPDPIDTEQLWEHVEVLSPTLVVVNTATNLYFSQTVVMELRCTFVCEKQPDVGWQIVNLHGALPAQPPAEGELWPVDVLRARNEQLEREVAERTEQLAQQNTQLEQAYREAQIEAALERVRARTMAMHGSEELGDVALLLYQELNALGVTQFNCGYVEVDERNEIQYLWVTSPGGGSFEIHTLPLVGDALLQARYEAWKRQDPVFRQELHGDQIKEHLDYVSPHLGSAEWEETLRTQWPDPTIFYCGNFPQGYLHILTDTLLSAEEEVLLVRFTRVFEQTYTRFLDLKKAEEQTRESEIQLALERIRARTMAMRGSDEMLDVGELLYKELSKLGITSMSSGVTIIDKEGKFDWYYMVNPDDGSVMEEAMGIPRDETKVMRSLTASWEKQDPYHLVELNKKETIVHQTYVAENSINFALTAEELISVTPEELKLQTFNFKDGYLLLVGADKLSKDKVNIAIRFAKVFEQTYTRFLDLKKAEEQTRESEIQLALERIRARTMAMHHSDELSEVAAMFFHQLEELGIESLRRCFIGIYDEDTSTGRWWYTTQKGEPTAQQVVMPSDEHPAMGRIYRKWQRRESFSFVLSGDDMVDAVQYWVKHGYVYPKGETAATELITNVFCFAYGVLDPMTYAPLAPEDSAIIQRFADVFEQTYTRFLDLKKAEAQAREAQIEVALERVRARSMAMHSSDELADVAVLLYKELKTLGIRRLLRCGYVEVDETNKVQNGWLTDSNGDFQEGMTLPLPGDDVLQVRYEAWKRQDPVFHQQLQGDEMRNHIEFVSPHLGSTEWEALARALPDPAIFYCGNFPQGYLHLITDTLLSVEEESLLARFTRVFEQTYTRFLDLQKAEAQAREAQIEAALERVRARSMAMHKSDELRDVVAVLFEQIQPLGFESFACTIIICDEAVGGMDCWPSSDTQAVFPQSYHLPVFNHPVTQNLWKTWKQQVPYLTHEATGDLKRSYDDLVLEQTEFKNLPEAIKAEIRAHESMFGSYASMRHGLLTTWSYLGPLPDDQAAILQRFARVFEQTYTRFLDLVKAEEQAREAQIEAALERVRARSMGMHKSDELGDVAVLLYKEFKALGMMRLHRCGYVEVDEKNQIQYGWMTDAEGDFIEGLRLLLPGDDVLQSRYEAWKRQDPIFHQALHGDALKQHLDFVIPHLGSKELEELAGLMPDPSIFYCGNFPQGYLHLITDTLLSAEEEAILVRFTRVFEQTYTRFLDLQQAEAQARESEIQLALERVRARTMAMHHSDELGETAQLMFQQVERLGIDSWGVGLHTWHPDEPVSEAWMIKYEGGRIPTLTLPHTEDPLCIGIYEAAQEGEPLYVKEMRGEALTAHFDFLKTLPHYKEAVENLVYPDYLVFHSAYFSQGFLEFVTYQPMPEAEDIFIRFARVFEQTYTRFLDLKKAEEQAREAQIEAALERVRAKAMAMHHSEELAEAAQLLYQEMVGLGITPWACGYIIMDETQGRQEVWDVTDGGILPMWVAPLDADPVIRERYLSWKQQESLHCIELDHEANLAHHHAIAPYISMDLEELLSILPERILIYSANFSEGQLFHITTSYFSSEQERILVRFARVFEQTYTRFLDLKKAEAQARESQIEAALERVRARSMAMHNSDELGDVAVLLYKELKALGVTQFFNCGYVEVDEENGLQYAWLTNPDGSSMDEGFTLPLLGDAVMQARYEGWKRQDPAFHQAVHGDDIGKHVDFVSPYISTEMENIARAHFPDPTIFYCCNFPHGYLHIITDTLFNAEEESLLIRFTRVFEQTYTRFLDLRKAEEQARESQIEAALERVRSRAMAMHHSDELREVVAVVLNELQGLGFESEMCVIIIYDKETKGSTFWASGLVPSAWPEGLHVPSTDHPIYKARYEAWEQGVAYRVFELGGEAKRKFDQFLFTQSDFKRVPTSVKEAMGAWESVWLSNAYMSYGILEAAGAEPLSDDKADILKRFARVFELTYTRFDDLQQAQARAREAEQQASIDRVRAEIASMRTAEDLDRITPLIWRELTTLGVPFFRCGVFIVDEPEEIVMAYLSTPEGGALARLSLPFDTAETIQKTVAHWKRKEVYRDTWSQEEFMDFMNTMLDQGILEASSDYRELNIPSEQLALQFVPFAQGMLYIGSEVALSDEQVETVQALADAFAVAYARYEDFQRLEIAKADVEVALQHLKTTQAQLVQSEKLASLGQLTAGIAHEIKNPLNFINNFAELVGELTEELDEEIGSTLDASGSENTHQFKEILSDLKRNAEIIVQHGKRADGIVSAMVQHASGGTGEREMTDVNELLEEYVNLAYHGKRAQVAGFNCEIIRDYDEAVGAVELVPQEIGRVFINLLGNAFDAVYMQNGNAIHEPQVRVSTERVEDTIRIHVEDNGPGIPEEHLEKIFEPFFTTKPTGSGTGLGLSMSYDIITQGHNGTLSVESRVGEGARFTITLPG